MTNEATELNGCVLVIERSAAVALMTCGLLRRLGLQAEHEAPGGPEVDGTFDLVIADPLDYGPRLATVRRGGVPWLAAMSAGAGAGDADGWVRKPLRIDDLRQAVRRCLQPAVAPTLGGIDPQAIVTLWGSADNASFRVVAEAFLNEMEQRLTAIENALAAGDRGRLLIEAHSVGGAAANVGGAAMSRAARALEEDAKTGSESRVRAIADALQAASRRDLPVLRRIANLADRT